MFSNAIIICFAASLTAALGLRFFIVPVVFFGLRAILWFLGFSPIQGVNKVEKRLHAQNDKLLAVGGEEEGEDEVVWGGWAER